MNSRRYRTLTASGLWILGLAMLVAVLPAVPARNAIAQGMGQANYGGVTFSYDRSLAANVRGQSVPSTVGQGVITYEVRPEHTSFTFDGYPSKGVWTPQIRVIPLAEYKSAQSQSNVSRELSALEGYIGSDMQQIPPLLPPINAQRIISEDVAAIAGSGVSGVRFIASYAQGLVPVGADNITYMFTGLTTDGKYYVEGTFPVALSTPLDPPPSPLTAENAQLYNQAVAEQLGKTGASGFTPNLDNLDKMMGSIKVTPQVIPGMPTTGLPLDYTWLLLVGLLAGLLTSAIGIVARRRGSHQ